MRRSIHMPGPGPGATSRSAGSALNWVLAVLALVIVLIIAGVWYVRANPLALYVKSTRAELEKAGLEAKEFAASSGPMTYFEGGSGPTLVLLHGAGDQAGAFQGVVRALLESHRVLIPDIPGHGGSAPAAGPLKMTVMYGGVEEFLAAEAGDEPAVLAGSSMGGWISLLYALEHPDRVARVIGINSGGIPSPRTDLSLMPPDREAARALMRALRDPASEPLPDFVLDDIVERSASGPIGRMLAETPDLITHLLVGKLSRIEVPVDLVWGVSDQLLPLELAERIDAELPRSRLTRIEGCGHHPANECPARLAPVLADLLAQEPPAAAATDTPGTGPGATTDTPGTGPGAATDTPGTGPGATTDTPGTGPGATTDDASDGGDGE